MAAKGGDSKRKSAVKRRAKKSSPGLFILFVLLFVVGAAVFLFKERPDLFAVVKGEAIKKAEQYLPKLGGEEKLVVTVYYSDDSWTKLVPVTKEIDPENDPLKLAAKLIALLTTDPGEEASSPLPKEAKLRSVFIGQAGELIVDFEDTLDELRSWGIQGELLAAYSVVNTLIANIESVNTVRILIGGEKRETLAGHVMIEEPLSPRLDLFKQ